jgi:chromate transporter
VHDEVAPSRARATLEVFAVALRLGLTSFGGPIAHLGYFRDEYVTRRRWIDDSRYADLVALCQFLPGPASSQVGIAIGTRRAGLAGGVASWLGFTLPSAVLLVALAYGVTALGPADTTYLRGLKIAAVAVVAHAVWGMARSLAPDWARRALAVAAALIALSVAGIGGQLLALGLAALAGLLLRAGEAHISASAERNRVGRRFAIGCWVTLATLLLALPFARHATGDENIALLDAFFRAGSLVFGGGHVVLPLLQAETVQPGWVSPELFVAGYGAAQAVPGPLFTFAGYLGATITVGPGGIAGAALALTAVFVPSFLLIWGALPFWDRLRTAPAVRAPLRGLNAGVVGLLLAALIHPVTTSAIEAWPDAALVLVGLTMLVARLPAWLVVIAIGLGGGLIAALGTDLVGMSA